MFGDFLMENKYQKYTNINKLLFLIKADETIRKVDKNTIELASSRFQNFVN